MPLDVPISVVPATKVALKGCEPRPRTVLQNVAWLWMPCETGTSANYMYANILTVGLLKRNPLGCHPLLKNNTSTEITKKAS